MKTGRFSPAADRCKHRADVIWGKYINYNLYISYLKIKMKMNWIALQVCVPVLEKFERDNANR